MSTRRYASQPVERGMVGRFRRAVAPPRDWLTRFRRVCLLLSLILAALLFQAQMVTAATDPRRALAGAALGWLVCRWIWDYQQPGTSPLWAPAEAVALAALGSSLPALPNPVWLLYLGLISSGLAFRTLTRVRPRAALVGLWYTGAYLGALAFVGSALPDSGRLLVEGLLPIPGFVLLAGAMHVAATVLLARDGDSRRQELLLGAGSALLATSTPAVVQDIARQTATQLLSALPEIRVRIASGTTAAPDPDPAIDGGVIVLSLLPDALGHRLAEGSSVTFGPDALAGEEIRQALGVESSAVAAVLVPLLVRHALWGAIVVAAAAEISPDQVADLETLARQVRLALERTADAHELGEREAAYRTLVQESSEAIIVVDEESTVQLQTVAVEHVLGYGPDALVGTRLTQLIHPGDLAAAIGYLDRTAEHPGVSPPVEWRMRQRNGAWIPVETIANNRLDDPRIRGIILTSRDISRRRAIEAQLSHQAFHDPLTNLANRARLMSRLRDELAQTVARTYSLAVLLLDLDRFKIVNDALGHQAGDQLLVMVAGRLRACIRSGDLVARLGGDEFAIVVEDIVDVVPATQTAERILGALQDPIVLDGHEIQVSASIGITLGRARQDRPEDLLRRADIALYEAKRQGKSRFAVYDASMAAQTLALLDLETELRHAIQEGQLRVQYQPLVSLDTGDISEFEALVRWPHPQRGTLLPADFVPLAEETGLIVPMGRWVLREACQQARLWQLARPGSPALSVSVNLSARQFHQPGLLRDVEAILTETDLPPAALKLEITESAAMADVNFTTATLYELKRMGVRLALDDFGTGYSSLGVLKHFPVDTLKVDRSFVAGLGQDVGDMAIVEAVVAFAKNLQLRVTAEGIETSEQLKHLHALACDQGQGFLFAHPLEVDAVSAWLARMRSADLPLLGPGPAVASDVA